MRLIALTFACTLTLTGACLALDFEVDLTKEPVNQHDQTAATFVVKWINESDGTMSGDLYDSEGNLIAKKRVYSFEGGYKNIPFPDVTEPQKKAAKGETPTEEWPEALVRTWLDSKGVDAEKVAAKDLMAEVATAAPAPESEEK